MLQRYIAIFFLIITVGRCQILPAHDVVDNIEDIEVESTQIIITTTKEGPVENLKVHIELIDIEANKKVNPVDLSGLWLTITRGRYTIPFLRPDTWYGVRFRSENLIDGRKVFHEDERLIKTKPREPMTGFGMMPLPLATLPSPILGLSTTTTTTAEMERIDEKHQKTSEDPILKVKMHRSLDGVENYESVYVTVSWESPQTNSNMTSGVVKLRVICESTETNEEIRLAGDEDSVTIEITMDQKYDIEETDRNKHQIRARITPLKCHEICWSSDLMIKSQFGDFKKHLSSDECKPIESTTSITYLREVKRVSVVENELSINELIVETEVAESDIGIVSLILQKLGGNDTDEPIKKIFDTTSSNGKFVVPIEDDSIYAVEYEYVKTKPFHYHSKTHFLVESPAVNSTRSTIPLVDVSTMPKTFDYKHDKPNSALRPEPPYVLLSRSSHYSTHPLIIHLEPFCHENSSRIRLEDRYPQHQIDSVNYLCGLEAKMYFCNQNVTYKKCDSTLCFSTSVLINDNSYDSETRCLNVSQHFPPLTNNISPLLLSTANFLPIILVLVSRLFTLFL